ncbi:hypothetical protein H9P43_006961 [Blastocladiella emersonii ATCC 22665]|nr:hypothetical protein H9P43_006961 [Blastocladiella emersonii ATCC 22665]
MKQKKGKSSKAHRKSAGGLVAAASHGEDLTSGPPAASSVPLAPPTQTSATLALDEDTDPYLPYGKSFPRDLLLYHNPRESKHLGVLVFQCGDLRDVAHTVGEAERKYGTANLDFVLSDTHFEVFARNLLVLRAVAQTKIADREAVSALTRHVGQLTYSNYLDPATRAFWAEQMRGCLATDWTAPDAQVRVLDDATRRGVRACWESWLAVDWSPAKFDQARTAFYDTARARKGASTAAHANFAVAKFRCRLAVIGGHPTSVMEQLVAMQTEGQDSYTAIETDRVLPLWFNAVQAGTIIDTCGMLNVLVHASPLLTTNWENDRSLILTATEHMASIAETRRVFLRRTTGLPYQVMPTLLGINFPEQAAIVSSGGAGGQQEFTFYKLAAPTIPIALRESPFLINTLVRCAELLLGPDSVAMAGHRAGSHASAALLIKLIGFAIAASRLTWTGSDALPFAPWPAMPELWDALRESRFLAPHLAGLQAQAMLYGFPMNLAGRKKGLETDLFRVEGILDPTVLNAARAAAPLSLVVLEIDQGGIVHQFRSLTTKLVDDGTKPLLDFLPLTPNLPDYSDAYLPGKPKTTVTSAEIAAHSTLQMLALVAYKRECTQISAYISMFKECWEGKRVIELLDEKPGAYMAVLLLHRVYIAHTGDPGIRVDPALASLMSQIAGKMLRGSSDDRELVAQFRMDLVCLLVLIEHLRVASKSAPSKEIPDDCGIESAFFARLKPKLTRCSIIQPYPTQDKDQSMNPDNDIRDHKHYKAAIAAMATMAGVRNPHAATSARASRGSSTTDSRIVELD